MSNPSLHRYCLHLSPYVEVPTEELAQHQEFFCHAVALFNQKNATSTVNRKSITFIEVQQGGIVISLSSEIPLESPGRALVLLTRLLVSDHWCADCDYDPFFASLLFHKKLFRTQLFDFETQKEPPTITDAALVKGLIDYMEAPKASLSDAQRKAVQKMKELALATQLIVP